MSKSKGISSLLDQYKNELELREFAEAQMSLVIDLNKRIEKLETENRTLKAAPNRTIVPQGLILSPDEEIIVLTQINILKDAAKTSELTLEQARKLEIYYKILKSIQEASPKKDSLPDTSKLSDEDLLKAVQLKPGHEPN